jgi:uncharacterized protein YcbX
MPTVARLSIAPVKALGLVHPDKVRVEPFGVTENRRFYLADGEGRRVSGPRHGRLMQVAVAYDAGAERLTLTFPDGAVVDGAADGVFGEPVASDFWGKTVVGHEVDGSFSAALSEWYGSPLRLIRTDRPGEANDVWPLSLMSTASAEALARGARADRIRETRRFRLLVEMAGAEPYEEDSWIGRTIRLGGAVARVPGPIPRCAVTTYDPDTGRRDVGTLKAIKGTRGQGPDGQLFFGVYGQVSEPGPVRVGDPVEPLDG